MSFLAGRLAATEGAFFSQHSKDAILRLKEKMNVQSLALADSPAAAASSSALIPSCEKQADMLPEVLRHCIPSEHVLSSAAPPPRPFVPDPSSLAASLKTVTATRRQDGVNMDATGGENPLAFFAKVPQVSFGPKRWKLATQEAPFLASTANAARMESGSTMDAEKLNAVMEGYFTLFKSFVIATGVVFGAATVVAGLVTTKLQINSLDDIRTKGHDYMQPRVESLRQSLRPWKQRAQRLGGRLHVDESHYNAFGARFKQSFGMRQQHGERNEQK